MEIPLWLPRSPYRNSYRDINFVWKDKGYVHKAIFKRITIPMGLKKIKLSFVNSKVVFVRATLVHPETSLLIVFCPLESLRLENLLVQFEQQ